MEFLIIYSAIEPRKLLYLHSAVGFMIFYSLTDGGGIALRNIANKKTAFQIRCTQYVC